MMNVSSSWNGDREQKLVLDAAWGRILRAAVFFWTQLQLTLNVSNPRPYLNSAPKGDPPRKRTGFGAGSVLYKADKQRQEVQVGLLGNAKYMAFHELGQHPWLLVTLKRLQPQLQRILEGGGKGGSAP